MRNVEDSSMAVHRFQKGNTFAKGVARPKGSAHHSWKEDKGYWGVHSWLKRVMPKASTKKCYHCDSPARDWANVSKKYLLDITDYIPLCRSCHMIFDEHKISPETAKKISMRRMGHKHSDATKKKISEAKKRNHAQK